MQSKLRERTFMLRIEGRIANHDAEFDGAILIDTNTGLIEFVGPCTGQSDLDTNGCLIFPGFGDIHIHAREDVSGTQMYKEDFASVSAAALHGGVVQVADMPNNPIAPVDDASYFAKELLTSKVEVTITLYAGIGPATRPLNRHVPYKAFMGPSVGELFFSSQAQLEEAIQHYHGRNVSFHCEDPVILQANEGAGLHEDKRPASAEITATAFALYLIEKYELQGKLCHYSTKEGLALIADAKARGIKVTCEVTPHHLFFDTAQITPANRQWLQMNPPLRAPLDRLALLAALRSGLIDYVATDHAPHTLAEKETGHSGVPHLDTLGPFATWLMAEHGFTTADIARVFAYHPAVFVQDFLPASLGKGFGHVAAGFAGSLTILDPDRPYTVARESLQTKCGWSPFEGFTFPGSVRHTIHRGVVHAGS
jgi:dihydroorotase